MLSVSAHLRCEGDRDMCAAAVAAAVAAAAGRWKHFHLRIAVLHATSTIAVTIRRHPEPCPTLQPACNVLRSVLTSSSELESLAAAAAALSCAMRAASYWLTCGMTNQTWVRAES